MTLLIVSFIAGALTVLAPCVLPLLPVILGGAATDAGNKRRPLVIIGSLSVSVFIFTLLLKGSTALIGVAPSFWTYISATILAIFSLTLIFPEAWARVVLKIPGHNKPNAWISRGYKINKVGNENSKGNSGGHSSFIGDIIVGAALGPVFTTCSPTFFVILATVLPRSLIMGIVDLAAYIIGLALILLLIAYIGQRLIDRLEWAANPYGWFRKILGALFFILAALIAFGLDKKIETYILASGFFDVTTLEQSIHQSLEGPKALPQPTSLNPNAPNIIITNENPTISQNTPRNPSIIPKISSPSRATIIENTLGAPPAENNEGKYIEIAKPAGFVNSQPFQLADFIGKKVILIDFIDYSCINCERTFPYLNDWWGKYKDQGLEIVAIHTPEFSFEKEIANVTAAAKQFKLEFPIVLDNDYATWNAYANEYWPHKYLIDIHGNVVYDHIGEGGYAETEAEIVKLLNDRKAALSETGTIDIGKAMPTYTVQTQSPETYFGAMRNNTFGNGQPGSIYEDTFTIPQSLSPDTFYLGGDWNITKEYIENEATNAQISFVFDAANVYLVAASTDGGEVDGQILIDGKPITADQSGVDVSGGIVKITGSRLYRLYSSATVGQHRVDIIFNKKGARGFTFTFG